MIYQCAQCGHKVSAEELPIIKWDDGHICIMMEKHVLEAKRVRQEDYKKWRKSFERLEKKNG